MVLLRDVRPSLVGAVAAPEPRGRVWTMPELVAMPEGQLRYWAYNALDCTGTRKVWDVLRPRLDPARERTYAFHRALQAPVMAMMRRGVRVDQLRLNEALKTLRRELAVEIRKANRLPVVKEKWDGELKVTGLCPTPPYGKRHKWPRGVEDGPERKCEKCGVARVKKGLFNPNSHEQCAHLFHDLMGLARMKNKKKEWSVDDEVLEKLALKHPQHGDLFDVVRECRGLKKQIGFLSSRQTPSGRMPSTFNVAAAWTSRFSSSKNPYGLGTNLQNISERHRNIFIPDPGMELFYADLERAESLVVAYVSGDEGYIKAHDGDTHTLVASYLWPDLPWTGDPTADKKVAEQNPTWDPAPGHSYRFQAKRIQHGSNFGLAPFGIAMIAHIPVKEAAAAQGRYFDAFPGIPAWQRETARKVAEQEPLVNPLGYTVALAGRPWDGHTVRQALSLVPQSTVAHVLNLGLWRVWRELDPELVMVLAQIHDAILGQWPVERREVAAKELVRRMKIAIPVTSPTGTRTMTIQVEVMAGGNWGKFNDNPKKGPLNPRGLKVLHV